MDSLAVRRLGMMQLPGEPVHLCSTIVYITSLLRHLTHPVPLSPTSTSASQSPSSNLPASDGNSTDSNSGSSSIPEERPADALNGTAMATVAYDAAEKYSADTTSMNYLLFYQHSSGDIRRLVFNQSEWHSSELITSDARVGTGLSVVQFGAVPTSIYMYYIDKLGYLQELRSTHGSSEWTNGTLGQGHFKATDTYSALSARYVGDCGGRGNIGWVLYESVRAVGWSLLSICSRTETDEVNIGGRNPRGPLGT